MLAHAHRLRRAADFQDTFRRGARAGRRTLVVHVALAVPTEHDDLDRPGAASRAGGPAVPAATRFGFAVSRAVGSAVTRNTVTRRLRHLAAAELATLPTGAHVVVRALPPAATASYEVLRADLHRALLSATTAAGRPRRAGSGVTP